ncbi:sulfur oxidation c-type cytochrome SoxX [Rhodoplanes sp. Z2-YC6860]|uniref:sulfur oxidation c-type cytochrome SoxX n=1 Tax=Rhodoplanes sp. Z2-YC6860 TaxID=674703 RepID=UPI00078DA5B4|nr:sulfur oxidation c-type cytochrome SoxX [Rhodoplanes sp. Z2-YC6860]AMN43889.1 sulfur oxidation protein SoxX [Rhodoplanes sp. Z2-YC6860]
MKRCLLAVAVCLLSLPARAQDKASVDTAKVDAAIVAAFPTAPADWRSRFDQDETMKQCSLYRNAPPKNVAEDIQKRERARIQYPADGKLVGDWSSGEKIAQSGYGLRFTDYPPRQANGGNCYACHQLSKAEVSYGTIGPSLMNYGKNRNFSEADTKAVYDKIYGAHAAFPCSNMPRFGVSGVLNIEQIKDLVALVMSPDSPVNK